MANNGIIYNVVKKLNSIFSMQQTNCCLNPATKSWYWDTMQLTSPGNNHQKYAVLVLNRPITLNPDFLRTFWNNATVRITVDGGTVQWDKYVSQMPIEVQQTLKLPTLITGDFDSVTAKILEKYKQKGMHEKAKHSARESSYHPSPRTSLMDIQIIKTKSVAKGSQTVHTPDQNHTDFTKALMELNKHCQEKEMQMDYVIAIGQSSGRLDQILGNIQTLFLNKERQLLDPRTKLYLMSDDAVSWLLSPGDHVITVPEDARTHKRAWCSLIPIGEACESVSSSGLKWNLDSQPLKFGELVSTSNTYSGSEKVTISCSHTLLWSMRIPSLRGLTETEENIPGQNCTHVVFEGPASNGSSSWRFMEWVGCLRCKSLVWRGSANSGPV